MENEGPSLPRRSLSTDAASSFSRRIGGSVETGLPVLICRNGYVGLKHRFPRSCRLAKQPAINPKREEIRGMFVIGVVATLWALLSQPSLGLSAKLPLEVVAILYIVMLYWGLYAFFMAIGMSSDILNADLAQWAAWIGHSLFRFSVVATFDCRDRPHRRRTVWIQDLPPASSWSVCAVGLVGPLLCRRYP